MHWIPGAVQRAFALRTRFCGNGGIDFVNLTGLVTLIHRNKHLYLRSRRVIGSVVLCSLLLLNIGCAKRAGQDRELPGPDEAWQRIQHLMQRERFFRAQQLLKDFVLNYSGSAMIDSAQFSLGLATFQLEDYVTAAEEFKRVETNYPFSKLGGDAAFYEALCYYKQAPGYQLDQSSTTQALDAFQRFLEEHSGHSLQDSAYKYIGLCRDKLGHKEFAAARLYYDLDEFASAVLYCDGVLSNYYDTQWAHAAQFLKARSFSALKDRVRARQEYQTYLDKYPQGEHAAAARRALSGLPRSAETQSSASQ
jgi:outer membrane protein assembly factor BamD